MVKFLIVLVATLMVASSVQGGMHDLKGKLMHMRHRGPQAQRVGSYGMSNAYTGGYGSSSSSASAAAGNGYAAAAASTSEQSNAAGYNVGGGYQQGGYHQGGYQQGVGAGYGQAGYGNAGANVAAAASVQNNVYQPAPVQVQAPPMPMGAPVEPPKPNFDINQFKAANNLGFRSYFGAGGAGGRNSVAAAAAAGGSGGNMASAAAAASGSYQQGGFNGPNSFSAASGTFAQSNNNGLEQRHFSDQVENMENHEMGRADDDHYYNAKSYGKAADDNDHINYNKNFEDVMSSPTVYHSRKSTESLLRDHNKSERETGSAVMAKDHHSAGFQKHQKHFKQNTNSGSVQNGAGGGYMSSQNDALNHNINDDDEMYFDSDGLAGQNARSAVGMATQFGQNAGASAAVQNAYGGGSASSAAYLQGYGNNGFGNSASAAAAVN